MWKVRPALAGAVALVLTLASPLTAQWPPHPDRYLPRTADGEPDLEAPTPRTADGKVDFSGVWMNAWFYGGKVHELPESPPGEPPAATFGDVFANFDDDPPFQPWAAQLKAERRAENAKNNPDAMCLPMGLMQFHMHPQPRKVIQTPGLILVLYEGNAGIRQIFTDGRPLPDNDPQPWWYGYSIGHWDGDTLVVETTGFRDNGWLDIYGSPLTDAASMTERWTRPDFGTIQIDVTVDDPKAYTEPFSVRVHHHILLDDLFDAEIMEFICPENNRSLGHMVGR